MRTWLVTGSTGFVGQALRRALEAAGCVEAQDVPTRAGSASVTVDEHADSSGQIQVLYAKRGVDPFSGRPLHNVASLHTAKSGSTPHASALIETGSAIEPDSTPQSSATTELGPTTESESLRHPSTAPKIDTVIHLAGVAHVGRAAAQEARAVNLGGTLHLLDSAIAAGVRRFVYLSSTLASAAETPSAHADITDYGRDKLAAERALLEAAAQGKIEVVILRSVNIYGVGMRGNIAAMIRLTRARRLPRLPRLTNRVSPVGVDDVAAALLAAAKLEHAGMPALQLTLTDGNEYRINELQDAVFAAIGRRPSHLRLPRVLLFAAAAGAELLERLRIFRSGIGLRTYRNLTRDNVFDNTDAREALGFVPTTTFYEALPRSLEKGEEEEARPA